MDTKSKLLELADILDCSLVTLRRDGCGDYAILGRWGHIYAVPEGFLFVYVEDLPATVRPRAWTSAKKALPFLTLAQNGDDEGVFSLARLPTTDEAELIRGQFGIRKRRHPTEETIARLREVSLKGQLASQKRQSRLTPVG